MLSINLDEIIKELFVYENISREDLYQECINDKLKQTVKNYNDSLEIESINLLRASQRKVLKAIAKLQKIDDRQALKQAIAANKQEKIKK